MSLDSESRNGDAGGYWAVLEPYWERIDIYSGLEAFLATSSTAPELVRILFAAHFCQSEVANGGFHQFFSNPTGVLAPEAAWAYRTVGLPELAEIVDEAMAFFGSPFPREQDARLAALPPLDPESRDEYDPFSALDERFFAACSTGGTRFHNSDRLYDVLDAYSQLRSGGAA